MREEFSISTNLFRHIRDTLNYNYNLKIRIERKDLMTNKIQYVSDLAVEVSNNPHLAKSIQENPSEALASIAASPLQTDVWIYRMVVIILGVAIISTITGAIVLAFQGKNSPESIISLGSVALGALAGLLAPSPKK
jgi:hypothetical protein